MANNVTKYALAEQQGNDYADDYGRFDRLSPIMLAFCGKNRSILTQRASDDPPLTGIPSDNHQGDFDGGIEIGWYGDWQSQKVFDYLISMLDRCKDNADVGDPLRSYFTLGSYTFKVEPKGAVVGRIKYKFVLIYHGLRIYVHANPMGDIQPVRVKIGAIPLLRVGLLRVYKTIVDILFSIGFRPTAELVSRADLQIMTSDYSVFDFVQAMQGGRFVTLARGKCTVVSSLSTGDIESITCSSRTAELCIYDKLAELASNKDARYVDAFTSRFYPDGNLPPVLTRVELRLRGEALRSFEVLTIPDLIAKARGIAQYMLSKWFRLLRNPKVRGMGTRQHVADIWRDVQYLYHKVFCRYGLISAVRVIPRRIAISADRLCKIAGGVIAKALVLLSNDFSSAVSRFDDLYALIRKKIYIPLFDRVKVLSAELAVNR